MIVNVLRAHAAVAVAAALAGCGPAASLPPAASAAAPPAASAKAAHAAVTVKPAKLDFTTSRKLELKITESGYSGGFKLSIANGKIARETGTAKGPESKVRVIAEAAGATTLTVADALHHSVRIPISVTTAVVVVR
jgi:hypothetical protein